MFFFKKLFAAGSEKRELAYTASVYRHADPGRSFVPAGGTEHIAELSRYAEEQIGSVDFVVQELVSEHVHVDIYVIRARQDRPWHVLLTSGMSDKAMRVPEGSGLAAHAELCMLLPAHWPLEQSSWADENIYWPVRWLRVMARFPHESGTWIAEGHTIRNGEHNAAFAPSTRLGGLLVLSPRMLRTQLQPLRTADGKQIYFYSLLPLYPEEMAYNLKHGSRALLKRLEACGVTEVIDPHREKVV